jgi:hypothetical protein
MPRVFPRVCPWLALLFVLWGVVRAEASTSVPLVWDPSPEQQTAGYILRVGTTPGVYTQWYDVGLVTSFMFHWAVPGRLYCFVVVAYFPGPIYGERSDEVCGYSDRAPFLSSPGNQSSEVGHPVAVQLQGSDPDGLPITYAATQLPAGLSLMPSTGFISGTPTTAQTVSVTASVSDGVLSTSRGFSWSVRPPLTFVNLTANRAAPQLAETPIAFTAVASGGTSPYQYRWWLHDGRSWQMLRDWSTSPTFIWTPTAGNAAYRLTVWIKDANSTTSTWDVSGSMAFPITALLPVSLTADRLSPQLPGTAVTFTASASSGRAPYRYRWWLYDGAKWAMLRDWSTTPTFTWTPAALNTGYRITVWAKNGDSTTTTWDGSAAMDYPIAAVPPLHVTLTANRVAPQLSGTTVTFTATATGGRAPYQYRWWVHDGVSWQMIRDWTTSASFAWTPPTPNPAHRVTVWVKSAGSTTTTWDASASLPFAIR